MWNFLRNLIAAIRNAFGESDDEFQTEPHDEQAEAKARARFWAELREGEREADARSRS
jgi:hypothetical protein